MSFEPEWEDPPAVKGRMRGSAEPRLEAMRANPKRWMVWMRAGSSGATTDLNKRFPGFEFVGRGQRLVDGHKKADIYARYVGE